MKNFRKISFVFILTAMVMLTLHALVPHHHQAQQSTELICTTQHAPVHHCTQHKECVEKQQGCCGEDILCGLSHIFTNSAVHPNIIVPIVITCQSVVPMPDISQPYEEYIPSDAPLMARLIVRDVPLRAPPCRVVFL